MITGIILPDAQEEVTVGTLRAVADSLRTQELAAAARRKWEAAKFAVSKNSDGFSPKGSAVTPPVSTTCTAIRSVTVGETADKEVSLRVFFENRCDSDQNLTYNVHLTDKAMSFYGIKMVDFGSLDPKESTERFAVLYGYPGDPAKISVDIRPMGR